MIVLAHSKDETGIWYGIGFTNYLSNKVPDLSTIRNKKIFGRKIESSIEEDGFSKGLDVVFVDDSLFNDNPSKLKFIGRLNLDPKEVKLGSQQATSDYNDLISAFSYGTEKRLTPPDHYKQHLTKLDSFRPDEYFNLIDYLIDKK